MLAAIVPAGEKIWFFKLTGAEPAIAAEKPAFDQFIASVRFADSNDTPVTWTLPDGWRDAGGKSQLRYATIRAGAEALELSVTPLGAEAGDLKNNVNRWRGQIGLKPVANDAELEALCQKINVDGKPGTQIDMTGMNEPVAAAASTLPAGKTAPPSATAPPVMPKHESQSRITYTRPESWTELPVSGMRVAAFRVVHEGQTAEITVIPLGGMAGGLLGNVNRWRKEVGLPDINEDQLKRESKTIDVGGQNAVYVDLAGKDKRNLGAILARDDATWFVKFQGPAALVDKERANFEAFVRSIRFAAGERS
jgi:hypothetical protein